MQTISEAKKSFCALAWPNLPTFHGHSWDRETEFLRVFLVASYVACYIASKKNTSDSGWFSPPLTQITHAQTRCTALWTCVCLLIQNANVIILSHYARRWARGASVAGPRKPLERFPNGEINTAVMDETSQWGNWFFRQALLGYTVNPEPLFPNKKNVVGWLTFFIIGLVSTLLASFEGFPNSV